MEVLRKNLPTLFASNRFGYFNIRTELAEVESIFNREALSGIRDFNQIGARLQGETQTFATRPGLDVGVDQLINHLKHRLI